MSRSIRHEVDLSHLSPLSSAQKSELEALSASPENAIDYSDIPPLDESFLDFPGRTSLAEGVMKYQWTADDIIVGRRYSTPGIREEWMIGYLSGVLGPAKYVSISLSDGMVTSPNTREELAKMLTEYGYSPVPDLTDTASGMARPS